MTTIHVDIDDEITTVIDKLKKSKEQGLILHIPKDALILQSIVNLKLLKRESEKLDKRLKIKVAGEKSKKLAAKAGLAVVGGVKMDEVEKLSEQQFVRDTFGDEIEIKTSKGKQAVGVRGYKKINEMAPERAKKQKPAKAGPRKEVKIGPRFTWKVFLVVAVIAAVAIGALWVFLPKATVTLHPKEEDIGAIANATVETDITELDISNGLIPGIELEKEGEESKTFDATGEKNTGNKSSGKIIVYNSYSTVPRKLASGTRFQDPNGKIFITQESITIPGYTDAGGRQTPGAKDVSVQAEDPGEEGNIDPTTFVIPSLDADAQTKLYGKSSAKFSGGSDEMVKAVSEDDLKKAEEELKNKLQSDLQTELKSSYQDYVILDDAVETEVLEAKSSKEKDEAGDQFTFTVKAETKTIGFKKADKDQIVEHKLETSVPEGMSIVESGEASDRTEVRDVNFDEGTIDLFIHITRASVTDIDTSSIADQIKGYTKDEAQETITKDVEVEKTEVELWPFWAKRVPRFDFRIKVEVEDD